MSPEQLHAIKMDNDVEIQAKSLDGRNVNFAKIFGAKKVFVKERFKLPQAVVDEIQSMKPEWGYGLFSEVVFYRTYSRMKKDGSVESWNDVVIRCVEGVFSIRKDWYIKAGIHWDEDFWSTYARGFAISMFNMEWLPPGRGLWSMGSDFVYERGSMALNNCGFIEVGDDVGDCCDWIADCLMCGVGVGFTPIRNDDFEVHYPTGTYKHVIGDSREEWCRSIKAAIDCYCTEGAPKPIFDYSVIRVAGLPIHGYGGVSSGPEPLIKLHGRIDTFFEMYIDLDWYDTILLKADIINCIGACVVAGNVRRSAEICLGSINDQVFMDLKNYEKYPYRAAWGWMSNNSAMLDVDGDYEQLGKIAASVITRGEPGILNRKNIKYGRIGKFKDKVPVDVATGCNPCTRASSLVVTRDGIRRFDQICVGTEIWSETGWTTITAKWSNGYKDVYRWKTTAGYVDLTDNHRVVCAGEKIEIGDAIGIDPMTGPTSSIVDLDPQDILDGVVLGDGTVSKQEVVLCIGQDYDDYKSSEISNYIFNPLTKYREQFHVDTTINVLPYTYLRTVPDRFFYGDVKKIRGLLRGLYSANGCFTTGCIGLSGASFTLISQVQKLLSSLGIHSYYTTKKERITTFEHGDYFCQESYDLKIGRKEDVAFFMSTIGFIQGYKNKAANDYLSVMRRECNNMKSTYEIVEVISLGLEEVFDITVDNITHTYWCDGFNISNCGEQLLQSKELCTLSETLPTRCKTVQAWYKACEYATMYASTVTLLPTHRQDTNSVMLRNRRIGVGLIDFTGWKHQIGLNQVIKHLRVGYDIIRSINHWCQSTAGVPDSIRVTTTKPSGTVSKLAGKTPGVGHPNFHHTLRRMRIAIDSPLTQLLIEANIPYELDVVSDSTYVFEFPIIQGPARPAGQVSLWEQLSNVVTVQREFSDNSVSNTITFIPEWELALTRPLSSFTSDDLKQFQNKEFKTEVQGNILNVFVRNAHHEEAEVEHALAAHVSSIKSLSLLPASSRGVYRQMPEEGISPEEYVVRQAAIKPIDWTRLRHCVAEPEKYCTGEACELPTK